MKIVSAVCLFLVLVAAPGPGWPAGSDLVLRRAPVPDKPPYQGEVRLVQTESALVVQTILNSKVLRQVVGAIRQKELKAWPEERDGWLDSRRYADELYQAYDDVSARAKADRDNKDRYLQLLIEFVLEGRRAYVDFSLPTLVRTGDRYDVQGKELLSRLKTSRNYLYNNQITIVADSFGLKEEQAEELLRSLLEEGP